MRKRVALKICKNDFKYRYDTSRKAHNVINRYARRLVSEIAKTIGVPNSYCRSLGVKRWEAKPNMITGKLTVMEDDNND